MAEKLDPKDLVTIDKLGICTWKGGYPYGNLSHALPLDPTRHSKDEGGPLAG